MRFSSSSKPISSPGRTEKFPPPLMRFLRSNVGSRSSRGRTRKPPLFMRRKKALTSSSAIETTQEPSSPKVTCMGQVRVRRSKSKNRSSSSQNPDKKSKENNNNKKNNKDANKSCCCCCYCIRKSSGCKWNLCKPKFPKWVLFFNCRSVKVRTDSSKFGSSRFEQDEERVVVEADERRERRISISIEEITTTTTTTTTTPPKNALLLTRCRSAPYRSSSLACRFWGSPLRGESEETETETETENSVSGIEASRDSTSSQSRGDQDSNTKGRPSSSSSLLSTSLKKDVGICALVQDQGVIIPSSTDSVNDMSIETLAKRDGVDFAKALMLMRCKSEPARRDSGKLDPLSAEFWTHRRSGNPECSTIHSHAAD